MPWSWVVQDIETAPVLLIEPCHWYFLHLERLKVNLCGQLTEGEFTYFVFSTWKNTYCS